MSHAPVDISHVGGCPSYRRVFHRGAPSHGRHRLWGRWEYSNRNGPNDPNDPNGPSAPSNRSDYSSEASSFIPSSIRDLSRNEKLSLIVLRWLPSG